MLTLSSPQNRAASGGRVGATAAVYSAAILGKLLFCNLKPERCVNRYTAEYLTAEVLELAGNASKDLKVRASSLKLPACTYAYDR